MVKERMVSGNTGCLMLPGNCVPFYCIGGKEWILLDSGSRFVRQELSEYLEQNEITVKAVICSHAHFDHTENNRFLQEKYGAEIIMTAYDAGTVHDALALKSCFYSHTAQENESGNGEMLCRADRVLPLDASDVEVCGARFELVPLPGHAASHMGIVTPDNVIYLADSLFTRDALQASRLIYMLSWSLTLKTLEQIKDFHYEKYILAHCGAVDEIKMLAEENICQFTRILEKFQSLCQEEGTLEELTRRVIRAGGHVVRRWDKARLYERIVRSMTEYLLEEGKLHMKIRDGIIVYYQ